MGKYHNQRSKMKQKSTVFWSEFSCLALTLGIILFTFIAQGQTPDTKPDKTQIWENNCALRHKYWSKLIFTAIQSNGKTVMAADDRADYLSVFEGLILDDEPQLKIDRDEIINLIAKAPGDNAVAISPELDKKVEQLWVNILEKGKSFGIQCE
jgi:hypothetical protein